MSRFARHHLPRGGGAARPGFTLAELLVAMAIIAIIAGITVVSVRGITKDARLSSGANAVTAALDNARALAMKNNRIVLVAFRPRFDGNEQYVEAVTAWWTGEAATAEVGGDERVVDRFEPIPDVIARDLPSGIKVAGASYGSEEDELWVTQSHLPAINQDTGAGEAPGEIIAVMYAADGSIITRNPQADVNRTFLDFNRSGHQTFGPLENPWTEITYDPAFPPTIDPADFNGNYFYQSHADDEPYLSFVPFLAVFDDDEARERFDTSLWTSASNRNTDLKGFIDTTADRIHFNRYTGVVMR
ncbi:MAG: prepilin-type N-terminal cleavage/methylation domain-containing protein [Planctomycetota bacterium]|nr:prepilin-type N-terminal cleavage/methylation domain-containing protein [Planctomycetota bacterium]